MPAVTADSVLQLRGLLVQLDHADRTTRKEDVSRLCKELLDLGRRWPEQALEDEGKAFERLGRQLTKFSDAQQRDIVATFHPLREDVQRRLIKATSELNVWLGGVDSEEGKSTPERLTATLQAIEGAPQLQWYKECTTAENKAKFLMALASVVRSVQSESAPLHSYVAGHAAVGSSLERLTSTFFVVPPHGNIIKLWHDGRLKRYNATLWRAAKAAADQFKDDLQVRLVTALRRKASQVAARGDKARPHLQLELCKWPMVKCPLANAFLDFVAQRGHELGDLGKPQLSECPPHSLRPRTLCRLLERLDAFELVEGNKDKDQPGIVRLRWEAVTALAFEASHTLMDKAQGGPGGVPLLGTKPKACSAPPAPTATGSRAEGGASSVASSPSLQPVRPSGGAEAPASKATPRQAAARRPFALVDRTIPWGDARFLQRVVRRGIRAEDEEFSQLWHQFCKQCRIAPDVFEATIAKGPLTEFVQRNMATIRKKEWAKDLLFKVEGQTDDLPVESDVSESESADELPGAAAQPQLRPPGTGARAAPRAADPRAAAPVRPREESVSSASESSQPKERRKKKKRKMLGYGDYFRGQDGLPVMTPEVMMMNQMNMMGMSMMMNNPMAMMGMPGMGASMMPHQMGGMMPVAGMKVKKEDKSKKLKVEVKPQKPLKAPQPVKPARASRVDPSLIDADDL